MIKDNYFFQEEEIVKPKQAKRRKKAISDSDWHISSKKYGNFKHQSATEQYNKYKYV